jgi:hypothetical protein
MSGVPPSGPRSTRGFPPLAKPVAGLRPLGSRSLTPSSHPQLAAQRMVWRGHPPSRLQGALSMKAPGSIRLGNKRAGAPGKPGPGEIAVDIDRRNRILGNPFVLHDPTDAAARNDVLERFRAKYEADLKCDGPMSAATERASAWSACAGVGRSVATAASSSTRSNGASNERPDNAALPQEAGVATSSLSAAPRYVLQMSPPQWIKPQLCKLAAKAPSGPLRSSSTATASPPGSIKAPSSFSPVLDSTGPASIPPPPPRLRRLRPNPPILTASSAAFAQTA